MSTGVWTHRSEMDYREITINDIDEIEQLESSSEYLSTLRLRWNPLGSSDRLTDIGSYCYGKRKGTGGNIWVNKQSLIRHPFLAKIIKGGLMRLRVMRRPLSSVTIGHLTTLLYNDTNFEFSSARDLFNALVAMLRTYHAKGRYSNGALTGIELSGLEILTSGFGVNEDRVCAGVRRLRLKNREPKDRPILNFDTGTQIANAAADHFLEISRAVLANAPLPWRISVAGKPVLVTASHFMKKGLPRYLFLDEDGRPPIGCIYDENYELEKRPIIRNLPGRNPEHVRKVTNAYSLMRNEKKRLRRANASQASSTRKRLITEALLSFCIYTYFDTGANASTLQGKVLKGRQVDAINLQEICDGSGTVALDIDRGSKCYVLEKSKARAKNKTVSVFFSSTWVKKILPTYIQLRDHLSDLGFALPNNLLFVFASPQHGQFRLETNPKIGHRLAASPGHILNVFLTECGMKRLSVGMIRNFKSVSISRESGVNISAQILGHDLKTALKQYNRISAAEAQLQIAGLINNIHKISVSTKHATGSTRLEQGGLCLRDAQDPAVEVDSRELGDFAPNCRTKTGCWLCPDFAVHADEEDLWKLSSYLHVLSELQQNSEDPRSVALVHSPVVRRLSALIDRISDVSDDLAVVANKVRQRIARNRLHPIYEDLLQVYIRVNLL